MKTIWSTTVTKKSKRRVIVEVDPRSFGGIIQKARESKNLDFDQLAYKVGVCPTTIKNIEESNMIPRPDTLVKLAKILGLDLKTLLDQAYKEKIEAFAFSLREAYDDLLPVEQK
jgi:ribosome-binding protein aMBF1 (putative translation factor)